MTNDLTNIGNLYHNSILKENFNSPTNDTRNSYSTGVNDSSKRGMPEPLSSQASANSAPLVYPFSGDISKEEKMRLLQAFLKDEIEHGDWNEKYTKCFKSFLTDIS